MTGKSNHSLAKQVSSVLKTQKRTDLSQPQDICSIFSNLVFLKCKLLILISLKRKYPGAPNQIALDNTRIRYVENPNSNVAKAKIIDMKSK